MRQVGYLQELNRDARSTEHNIMQNTSQSPSSIRSIKTDIKYYSYVYCLLITQTANLT